jgi:CRISPR system Cascade subunit CasA
MRRYNLIDEHWIPLRMLDGSYSELGIAETLLRAREIAAIEDPSPLVVAALHRFLLAILYRALKGPTDIDEAEIYFSEGWPQSKIDAYLQHWHDRFWLFDERYPFGQISSTELKFTRVWTTLTAEHNADNAKVLFDHTDVRTPGMLSEAAAARQLLAAQTFALSSGKSDLAHTTTAPSATAMMVLPIGSNLEKTLLFSLVEESADLLAGDLSLWEREPESIPALKAAKEREIAGFADLYTWRSRTVQFEKADHGVTKLAFASGISHRETDLRDPMVAYRKDEKRGLLPIQLHERGVWRDFDSILPGHGALAPEVIQNALRLSRLYPEEFPQSVMTLGLSSDKAKVKFWRAERFILPRALLSEKEIRSDIRKLINFAEKAQIYLLHACQIFARNMLSRGEREVHMKDVKSFVEQMACIPTYWSKLEAKFHGILSLFTQDAYQAQIEASWMASVKEAMRDAWHQHKETLHFADGWTIRAFIKADKNFSYQMAKITKEISECDRPEVK